MCSRNGIDSLPRSPRVDFVTDTPKKNSIKLFGHKQLGTSETLFISGPWTKERFIANDGNKTQLIKLLLDQWQKSAYAKRGSSVVRHLPLVLEVPGSIPARGE